MTTMLETTTKNYRQRPQAKGISVRRPQFNANAISRHYFANSPIMSHLLTALSSTFPIGEQFFVHSVRNVRDRVQDQTLQAEISAFIGQEAMHSKAHTEFNDAWRRDDYQLDHFQNWLARQDDKVKALPKKTQLAITCAFEHFTALLGGFILRHPEILSSLDEDAVKLWIWHAIEEVEHRAVAYNTYQAIYADHAMRRKVMRTVTSGFASLTFYSASRLFWQDKWKSLPKIGGNVFGVYLIAKMLIQLLPEYLSYYRDDFNPEQINYDQELTFWKEKLAKEYAMQGFDAVHRIL
ncbi:hypothetical protein SAMN05421749_10443 [Acinetobacter marinus]|uniref:Metal-dependent hydrolase n=1 Tax=Acinetobacter marinus TaxID=281375 RepID=A0A1G6KF61_9GAMM|nr:metal-dependent hydrolase [Acinetobacter marinus]SDC29719.1 hypothetical protein SAMN05421749_10443 [Acinetobacter marinus]